MNRRQVLAAAAGCAVALRSGFADSKTSGPGDARLATTPACALIPVITDFRLQQMPINLVRVERHLSAELNPESLARWDLDFAVIDNSGIPRTIYAWQLQRSLLGASMRSGGVRLRLPAGAVVGAMSNVQRRAGRGQTVAQSWAAALPSNALSALVTARASTQLPPGMMDLRFDAQRREVYLADGSKRDFDVLLIETS